MEPSGLGGSQPAAPVASPNGPNDQPSALDHLCAAFGLSRFERAVLLLCAGVELDGAFGPLCAAAQGDPARTYATFSLALAALPEPHWSALLPTGPLRRWRLVDLGSGGSLTGSPLRIDERVLHYLAGLAHRDERLAGLVSTISVEPPRTDAHRRLTERVVASWRRLAEAGALPVIQLCGDDAAARRQIAAAACAELGLGLCSLPADLVPQGPAEIDGLARLWEREAALGASALLVDAEDLEPTDAAAWRAVGRLLEQTSAAMLLATPQRRPELRRRTVTFDVPRPSMAEQRTLWQDSLSAVGQSVNGEVERLIGQFSLTAGAIDAAVGEALGNANTGIGRALWDACRIQARPRLDDLAQRIEPAATWRDLVLPEAQIGTLHDIGRHVRHRARVYEGWGFGGGTRGLGISALFAGGSGTGKTLAAEVLAAELRLDLYRVDLIQVVSKYIGETEKHNKRIFDAAEEGGAVILFDEADALFGKRSEVKDSHDRYANVEVSYLLQRMEAYRGLAILTTNQKQALDAAFMRRIRFVVQFPYPDAEQRAEIWRRIFPSAAPTHNLDPLRLARLNVAGGNIRNIALHAAFLAADESEPIRMAHVFQAARAEYAKLERTLSESEVGGWT
jgi:hypothetical protein